MQSTWQDNPLQYDTRTLKFRLKKEKAIARSLERKTKLAEKAKARAIAKATGIDVACGLARPVEGTSLEKDGIPTLTVRTVHRGDSPQDRE